MICGKATFADVRAIKTLWQIAFGDTEAEIDRFLRFFPAAEHALVLKEGDDLLSMLFLLPTSWCDGVTSRPIGYIYAGATMPSACGNGFYKRLLDYARDYARDHGMAALVLRPATAALEDSYRRMGFTVPLTCDETTTVMPLDAQPSDAASYVLCRRAQLQKQCVPFVDWDENTIAYAMTWCRVVCTANGAALYTDEDGIPTVWEWLFDTTSRTAQNGVSVTVRTPGTAKVIGLLAPLDGSFSAGGYLGYGLE